jgi:Domain of Unknown Function (DUF1080)
MRTPWLAVIPVALLFFSPSAPAQPEAGSSPSWRTLFDGKTLNGWEHIGPGKMVLEDGMIRTEGGMGLLWYTKEKFGDCVIRVVYKTSSRHSNSGIFVRIAEKPKDVWLPVHHGYEIQIDDAGDEFHGTGAIYSLSRSIARPVKPSGEWNTMEITLKGQKILIALNGGQVNDFDSEKSSVPERVKDYEPERGPRPASGYFGLQNHDDAGNSSPVFFKEVSVRPLTKLDVPKR